MSDAAIALNRFGLGARPGDRVGPDPRKWLLDQLSRFDPAPAAIAALPGREVVAEAFRARQQLAAALRRAQRDGEEMTAEGMPMRPADALAPIRDHYRNGVEARLGVALASDTPFSERLVHFWSNHFAISAEKPPVTALAANYEFTAIRPHLGGRFVDLAWAAISHPAMLVFLDQAQSVGPDSALAARFAGRRQVGLNENLAREVMELHTLGVRTGYTQADVSELARALTGWTVAGLTQGPLQNRIQQLGGPGETVFVPQLHEPGARTIMGKAYPAGGEGQARAVIADLAAHPATARHLALKLARHLVADDPPPSLVARLEAAFRDSGGSLPALHRALVEAPEAWNPTAAKFKSPWDWTVSALRAAGVERLPGGRLGGAGMLQQLGQPVWRPGSPAGWDDTAATWAGPGGLMNRVELAERIAERVGDPHDPRKLAAAVLPGTLSAETAEAIARADSPGQGLALLFAAPEFLRR